MPQGGDRSRSLGKEVMATRYVGDRAEGGENVGAGAFAAIYCQDWLCVAQIANVCGW